MLYDYSVVFIFITKYINIKYFVLKSINRRIESDPWDLIYLIEK